MEQYYNRKILSVPHEGTYYYSSGIRLNGTCISPKYVLKCLMLLLLNFPLTATAQIRDGKTRQQSAALLLCHQWNINKTSNFAPVIFPIDSITSVLFLPDGHIFFDRHMQTEAVWNYDDASSILYILNNGKTWKYAVSTLTENELILEVITNKKKAKYLCGEITIHKCAIVPNTLKYRYPQTSSIPSNGILTPA